MSEQNMYQLPKSWVWKPLGEVVTLLNGRAYKKDELLDDGPTPVLRVGNFFSNRSWYYSDLELPENKYCHKGDLLYAWSASFGPKIWDGEKAIYHYHIWKIVTSKYIDKHYLFYLLILDSAKIKSSGNGIAMMHATKGGMEKRQIPLPPIGEQQKIAEILDAADALRQKDQQLIDHYTRLSQSLFLYMFGDPVINPNNYKMHSLGGLCEDIFLGLTSKVDYVEVGEGYPLVRAKDINTGELVLENTKQISEQQHKKLTKNHLTKKGDLLVSKSGTLGTCAIVKSNAEFSTYESIFTVRPKADMLNIHFLISIIRSDAFNKKLLGKQVGGTVAHLNLKMFRVLDFPIPPLELQNQFAERIAIIEKQKQQAQTSLEQSNNLFNSLLQKAFTGELTRNKTEEHTQVA